MGEVNRGVIAAFAALGIGILAVIAGSIAYVVTSPDDDSGTAISVVDLEPEASTTTEPPATTSTTTALEEPAPTPTTAPVATEPEVVEEAPAPDPEPVRSGYSCGDIAVDTDRFLESLERSIGPPQAAPELGDDFPAYANNEGFDAAVRPLVRTYVEECGRSAMIDLANNVTGRTFRALEAIIEQEFPGG